MPLIKEDGTGLANANTYANVADADAYHAANLHDTNWSAATTPNKEKALELATRLIDGSYQFHGIKSTSVQALQWPRRWARDPDTGEDRLPNVIPPDLIRATCEMARECIIQDRLKERVGKGLLQMSIPDAYHEMYDKRDPHTVVPEVPQLFLMKLGRFAQSLSGSKPVLRS